MRPAALILALVACHKAPPEAAVTNREPQTVSELNQNVVAIPDATPAQKLDRTWTTTVAADHPLVGWVFSTTRGQFQDWDVMIDDLQDARYVFLGEKHDNPDHHQLQAQVITALKPRAVVFEQLDHEDPVADAKSPSELAEAVHWADSGWPPFEVYEPIFAAIYAEGGQIVPGHPTRAEVKTVMDEGWSALPPEATHDLPAEPKLPDALQADLAKEIEGSHCGMADAELVEKMTRAQLLKDTSMARALREHAPAEGDPPAVLVSGNGHARGDRGVPFWLDGKRRTVAFLEVEDGQYDPGSYVEGADWIVFTPRVDDEDPCAQFRK